MRVQSAKPDYFKLAPLIVLGWCLLSFIFIPIIPVASGFGWDGVFYGKVAMNFGNMAGSIDSYHANRIFPGVMIHYLLRIFYSPLSLKAVLTGYRIYNIVILTGAAGLWVLISKRLALSNFAGWLGFCALFINYPLLNLHFYYPALTDGTAFLLGFAMLYAYLEKKDILLLAVTMLAFFCWPAGIIAGFILYLYSDAGRVSEYYKRKNTPVPVILLLLSPFLGFIILNFTGEIKHLIVLLGLDGRLCAKFKNPGSYDHVNLNYLINSGIIAVYLVFVFRAVLKNLDLLKFAGYNLKKRALFKLLAVALILAVLVYAKGKIYAPGLATITPFAYFASYFMGLNVRFPFQFLVGQITYWGPAIILFLLFFKDIAAQLQKAELPLLLVFLYAVLFSINSEGRPIISFYPFLVVILLQGIDLSALRNRKLFVICFVAVSLFYSKIWFPAHLPASVFPDSIWTDLDKFPMQGYFMNFALFANAKMFWAHAAAAAVFSTLFYFVAGMSKPGLTGGDK